MLMVLFGRNCFLARREHGFTQRLQVFVHDLWVFPAGIYVRKRQSGEFGFKEIGVSTSDLFLPVERGTSWINCRLL